MNSIDVSRLEAVLEDISHREGCEDKLDYENLKLAIDFIKQSKNYIGCNFSREDVKTCIENSDVVFEDIELAVSAVIEYVEGTFDANDGINWDVINYAIDEVAK